MKKIAIFIIGIIPFLGIMAQESELYNRKLKAVEQVMIIDSLVVPRAQLLEHLNLSMESGRVLTVDSALSTRDSMYNTAFVSQLGTHLLYARQTTPGEFRLYKSDMIDGKWSESMPLEGLPEDENQNYPFMLTDGTTLYYAAQGPKSLGGYDIFMTRYDTDTKTFLAPENIGMPFNSTANDYLYMVDEYHNIGYFVTDRRQSPGYVCIYTFVPGEERVIYNTESTAADKLVSLAELNSIRDTQTDADALRDATERLHQMTMSIRENAASASELHFIINDRYTYTSFSQFRNGNARTAAGKWVKMKQEYEGIAKKLCTLRATYHSSNAQDREKLKEQILPLENQAEELQDSIKSQEKLIRSLEGR